MYIVINLLHKFVTCFSVTPQTYKFRYFVGNLLKETQEKNLTLQPILLPTEVIYIPMFEKLRPLCSGEIIQLNMQCDFKGFTNLKQQKVPVMIFHTKLNIRSSLRKWGCVIL